jgi:PII-like signaling protein
VNTLEQLTIYIDESDQWHGKPLFTALVEAARKQGLSGATVLRGVEGYGMRHHHQIHTARIMELADLPVVVTIIDTAEGIAQFLPTLQEMVTVGLVTQESINVVHHAPSR